ncbi:uncharacterized protein LOC108622524 isoform X2 [Ceratina calcarata]|uniref:Uncharacterized protein LOC108622524 isoform X2 n=1 Tax=Ceratina calcarata TaxID=156304 RepID=A0AAJ7N443_9HYME|nr:uncharacterized protein LOC108622524 isoform X2 [Ceratina calcarata]
MSAVYPALPKLSVKDGFDDEDLTDIDDEVFIRDGKSDSLKLDDDRGVKRPLMAPRRKYKKSYNFETYRFSNRAICVPLCFGFMALVVLLSLIVLCIYIVNIIPMPIAILKNWLSHEPEEALHESNIVPCTSLTTKILWTRSLPKLMSESPLRSNDVNGDGIEDIIVGFSTGLDITTTSEYVCTLYFDGQNPCFGGILALNGRTGDTLWMHWTAHAISSVDCGLDLNNDKIKDCIICGKSGILHAVNGDSGASLWELPIRDLEEWEFSDIYDAKFIADVDGDDVGDVIASHSMQSREICSNEILLISGINGHIIHSSVLPNTEQLFSAPQKLIHPDGESMFVLATSSQKRSGGLYVVPQVNLMYGDLKLRKLHHNTGRGTLLPPILVDVTLDGVEDIVAAMFNSTIIVYDGLTFKPIWKYTVPKSEVISVPIPGYYNDDDVPDFMVKHQIGSGFPTYYYTVATIIDGKTGKPLLERSIEDSLSEEMSGLSVTVDGFGNDWFLHWSVDCLNYEGNKEKYQFLKNGDFLFESRANLCKLRFNSTLITNLYALSQHVGPPGISLYFSEDWKSLEYNNSANYKVEYDAVPFVSERSAKIYKNRNQIDALKQKQGDSYENYNQFMPVNDNSDDDYSLRNEDKWTKKKIENKNDMSYEMPYNEDDKSNIQEVQPLDYQQVDEIREERSNVNPEFINERNNRTSMDIVNNLNVSQPFNTEKDGSNKVLNENVVHLRNNTETAEGITDPALPQVITSHSESRINRWELMES